MGPRANRSVQLARPELARIGGRGYAPQKRWGGAEGTAEQTYELIGEPLLCVRQCLCGVYRLSGAASTAPQLGTCHPTPPCFQLKPQTTEYIRTTAHSSPLLPPVLKPLQNGPR